MRLSTKSFASLYVKTAFLITFTVAVAQVAGHPRCSSRTYDSDSFVCVCDKHHCDSFAPIPPKEDGYAIMYVSDKAEHRFSEQKLEFKHKPNHLTNHTEFKIHAKPTDEQENRKIVGFGGSFTDAAGISAMKLELNMVHKIIENYYGENGLRYTMGRVPIGGADFSTHPYSYNDITDDEDFDLRHFHLAGEDLVYKIPLIRMAQRHVPDIKMFGSPWSAPSWMKTNHNLTGKGELRGEVSGKYYKTWANYFVKFLQEYARYKIDFWGLTIQNEPTDGTMDGFWFNCMAMSPEKQRDFIKYDLWPALNASGFHPKLMIGDESTPFVRQYVDVILKDPEAAKLVAGVAFHWYLNSGTMDVLANITAEHQDHFVISTEACEGFNFMDPHHGVFLGSWQRAENYAYDILRDLKQTASGWIDWNLVLDLEGGPNWAKNFVDAPIIVNATAHEYYKQPMYYALGHFSRFLTSGSHQLMSEVTKLGDDDAIDAVFFSTNNGTNTVAILLNRYQSQVPVRLVDGRNPKLGLEFEMTPKSIATIQW